MSLKHSVQHEAKPEDSILLTAVSPSLLQMLTSALYSNSLPMHFFCLREQWRVYYQYHHTQSVSFMPFYNSNPDNHDYLEGPLDTSNYNKSKKQRFDVFTLNNSLMSYFSFHKLNKQTLFVFITTQFRLYYIFCGGPCHLSSFKLC